MQNIHFPKKNRDKKEYKQTIFNHKKETFNIHLQIKTNTKIVHKDCLLWMNHVKARFEWNYEIQYYTNTTTIQHKYNYKPLQILLQLNTNPNSLEDWGRVRATSKQYSNDWWRLLNLKWYKYNYNLNNKYK